MSEFWERKMKTLFHRLDFDKDGLISKSDFELMAQRFCAAGKCTPVKQDELEKNFCYIWLKYMDSSNTDEKAFMTEAMFIDSFKKEMNDPKRKEKVQDSHRSFFEAMDTSEDGYLQRDEFHKLFENIGIPDASFAEQAFNAIDTNHAGKLSFDELTHAFEEFLFCEDEDSPYNLCWGPLI